jgi:hypothetical protein
MVVALEMAQLCPPDAPQEKQSELSYAFRLQKDDIDHWLIENRQQLLGGNRGDGIKSSTGASSKNNAFH